MKQELVTEPQDRSEAWLRKADLMLRMGWLIGGAVVAMFAWVVRVDYTNIQQTEQIAAITSELKSRDEAMSSIADRLSRIEERQISQNEATREIKEILKSIRE